MYSCVCVVMQILTIAEKAFHYKNSPQFLSNGGKEVHERTSCATVFLESSEMKPKEGPAVVLRL